MSDKRKVHLGDHEMPKFWYNIVADLPTPPPPVLNPGTGKPVTADDFAPVFCPSIIAQENTTERRSRSPGRSGTS